MHAGKAGLLYLMNPVYCTYRAIGKPSLSPAPCIRASAFVHHLTLPHLTILQSAPEVLGARAPLHIYISILRVLVSLSLLGFGFLTLSAGVVTDTHGRSKKKRGSTYSNNERYCTVLCKKWGYMFNQQKTLFCFGQEAKVWLNY